LAINGDIRQRTTALQQLSSLSALEDVINLSSNPEDIKLAKQRWANILIHHIDIDEFEAEQAVLNCTDEERLFYLVNQIDNANVGVLAFYGLRSESVLLELFRNAKSARLYPAIVGRLHSKCALEAALAHLLANNSEPKYSQLIKNKIVTLSP